MSWMDSWSRPTKHAATPPPLYLTSGGETIPYCHTCGRVISTRKSQNTKAACTPVRYCSDRCRHNKPSEVPGSVDHRIMDAFTALLDGKTPSPAQSQELIALDERALPKITKGNTKKTKGETRIKVSCAEVEALVFGIRQDPEKAFGRKKNRARRGVPDAEEWKPVDMEDSDNDIETDPSYPIKDPSIPSSSEPDANAAQPADMVNLRIRPPQSQSDANGSIGGEKGWAEKTEESPQMQQKRLEGQKRAEERELVRCAARRLCAFGVVADSPSAGSGEEGVKSKGGKRKGKGKAGDTDAEDDATTPQPRSRKCEAVMNGQVVEASYAKGEWGIRWRE